MNLVAGVASIPEREDSLKDMVDSILPQIDHLHVYLNNYQTIPDYLTHEKITLHRSQDHSDKGDAGKFFATSQYQNSDTYFFSLDDDLIYPNSYIQTLKTKIDHYNKKKIVSFHGASFIAPIIRSYYKSRKAYYCLNELTHDTPVHAGGTGVMGFHVSTIKVRYEDFLLPNMADIWIYKLSQEQRVGIICASHPKDWIKYSIKIQPGATIWDAHHKNDTEQTKIINQFPNRQLF